VLILVMDLPGRCRVIEELWFRSAPTAMSDYMVGQCDSLMGKMAVAIINAPPGEQDQLYDRLGDFQEKMLNENNRSNNRAIESDTTDS